MNKKIAILFSIFLLGALAVRMYSMSLPMWMTKETYQVEFARNLAKTNLNILQNQLSYIPDTIGVRGNSEPPYRFTEDFPLFNVLAAALMKTFKTDSLWVGRTLGLVLFLLGCFFLYGFAGARYGRNSALWALFLFAISPIMVTYSTYFMAEMAMVTAFLGTLYFLQKYFDSRKGPLYGLALFCAICVPAFRYYGAFLFFPLLLFWWERERKISYRWFFFFAVPALIPALWLYASMTQFNNPLHAAWHWGAWKYYLLDNSFYYGLMFERISKYTLTYLGFGFLLVGLYKRKTDGFLWASICAMLLSFGIFTRGHHINHYYQLKFVPFLVLGAGIGIAAVLRHFSKYRVPLASLLLVVLSILSVRQTYKLLRYNSSGMVLAEKVQAFVKPGEQILAIQDVPDASIFIYSRTGGWMEQTNFFERKDPIPPGVKLIVVRKESADEGFLAKFPQHIVAWKTRAPLGLHGKCGALEFFKNDCPRPNYSLWILRAKSHLSNRLTSTDAR